MQWIREELSEKGSNDLYWAQVGYTFLSQLLFLKCLKQEITYLLL